MNTTQLKEYAQLAQASYAHLQGLTSSAGELDIQGRLRVAPNSASRFSPTQAKQLTDKYTLVTQYTDVGLEQGDLNGFSATVFRDKASPNHLVISFRGTEFDNDKLRDLLISDLQIGSAGYAKPQAIPLYRYIRRLQTDAGQPVVYSEQEIQRLYLLQKGPDLLPYPFNTTAATIEFILDPNDYANFKASLQGDKGVDAGQGSGPVLAAGMVIDVTGHSLGGHLAMLCQRLFPGLVNGTAVTYNAVTFNAASAADGSSVQKRSDWILDKFGADDFSMNVLRVESIGDGVSEIGTRHPGITLTVGMETYPGLLAAVGNNHSVANIADGLALVEFIGKLDSRYMADPRLAKDLFKAGSNQPVSGYEKILDALRSVFGGPVSIATPNDSGADPSGSREPLYANLKTLAYRDDIGTLNNRMAGMVGKVRFDLGVASASSARSDFAQFLSLCYLAPFKITTIDATAESTLIGAQGELGLQWQADKRVNDAGGDLSQLNFTASWLNDREAQLEALLVRNQRDIEGILTAANTGSTTYGKGMILEDASAAITIRTGTFFDDQRQRIWFGSAEAETKSGGGLADHLYAGAGNDVVNGLGGEDWLEGNAGDDILDGGADNDTLLGGAGLDTYKFARTTGHDRIVDSQGDGVIEVAGVGLVNGAGARKIESNVWQLADRSVSYVLVDVDGARKDLYITFADRNHVITIQNWTQSKSVGITLEGAITTPVAPPPDQTITLTDPVGAGGAYADLTSYSQSLVVNGTADSDQIYSGADNDQLVGNSGSGGDRIYGRAGDDRLYAGAVVDIQTAITTAQAAVVAAASSVLEGGTGEDLLIGSGSNWMYGGAGRDTIIGGGAVDLVQGDTFSGGFTQNAVDTIEPTFEYDAQTGKYTYYVKQVLAGNTSYYARIGSQDVAGDGDVINTGAGNDFADGELGSDNITLGDGADIGVGWSGNDTVAGDGGGDLIFGDFNNDSSAPNGGLPDYMLLNYAGLEGAQHGNDLLAGDAGSDTIYGNGGADIIFGGDDADLIRGDDRITPVAYHGADDIDGGRGNDDIEGNGGNDTIRGGANNDYLLGDDERLAGQFHGSDLVYGDADNDVIVGGGAVDRLYGGTGNDIIFGDNRDGVALDAQYEGADQLFGESGTDTLAGGGGADLLDGGADDDELYGDAGNDTLIGGAGADYLDGGAGNDTYILSTADSGLNAQGASDAIADGVGINQIVLTDGSASALWVRADAQGGLTVDFGGASRVIVVGGASGSVAGYTLGDGSSYRFTEFIGSFSDAPVTATDAQGRTYVMGGRNADANLNANAAGQTLSGGLGNDHLRLYGTGGTTVNFNRGDGIDSVYTDPTAIRTQENSVSYGEGIAATDLRLRISSDSTISQGVSGGWGGYIGTATGEGMFSSASADQMRAMPAHFDTFTFSDGTEVTWQQLLDMRIVVDLPTNTSAVVQGTAYADEVTGDWANRTIVTGDGDDLVTTGSGNESIGLGAGSDTVILQLGFGQDSVYLSQDAGDAAATDIIKFDSTLLRTDAKMYRTADDLLVLFAPSGDQLTVRGYFTHAGDAIVEFADGASYTAGTLPLSPNADLATEAADFMYLTPGNDSLDALGGNDTIIGFEGNDSIRGGGGNDVVQADAGDDSIYGDDGNDHLTGGSGDLGDGNDLLDGGPGDDYLDGGLGNNTYVFGRGDGHDIVDRYDPTSGKLNTVQLKPGITPADVWIKRTGSADLTISLDGASADTLVARNFFWNNDPSGASGRPYNPVQQIRFDDGTIWAVSTIVQKAMTGSTGDDQIIGTIRADLMQGVAGNDTLAGQGGNDTFLGGDGNDELIGEAGNDVMDGGAGNDMLKAWSGTNTFQFGRGDGQDTVWYEMGAGATGTIQFKAGVLPSDVIVKLVADPQNVLWPGVNTALELSIEGTTDCITVNNFTGPYADKVVQQVRFADGTIWNTSQILSKQLLGTSDNDYLTGTAGADVMRGRAGNDQIFADAGDDSVQGDAGDDYIQLGDGADTATGGDGADGIYGDLGNDSISGDAGDDYVAGDAGNDTVLGGAGNDTLEGDVGDDRLEGGAGDDYIWASTGTDTYLFGKGDGSDYVYSDLFTGASIDGFSTLQFKAGVLPTEVSLARVYDPDWDQEVGLEISIVGTTDKIFVSSFFYNNDPHSFENPLQQIRFDNGQIWDLATIAARASGTFVNNPPTLATPLADQNVNEMVAFSFTVPTGSFSDADAGDVLTYSATLSDGSALPTWLSFNAGTRTFSGTTSLGMLSSTSVQVCATDGGGLVAADVFVLAVATQNLTLTGTSAANALMGRSGNDTISGAAGNDTLTGNAGNDSINGGTGTDSMIGGVGNDSYNVDLAADVIVENFNEGNDIVSSSVTYTLPPNVEKLTLTGTSNLGGTGNALANTIIGNSGANSLTGGDGDDTIDGGTGNDTMVGGIGDDTYFVNVATDVVTEAAGAGIDTISSTATLTALAANVENVTLTGTSALRATGNTLANMLIGNSGNNSLTGGDGNDTIDGGLGNDSMVGGNGDDTFYINVSTDVVTEAAGAGTDTVMAGITYTLLTNFENLTLTSTSALNGTGNTVDNLLIGNSAVNTLTGNAGNDTLDGAAGNDSLVGGTGADVYRFAAGYGIDTISENDITANIKDAVQFVGTVTQADVQFKQVGNNLEVLLTGTSDKIVVQNWYLGTQYQVEEFRFTDGTIMTNSQAQGMVTAGAVATAMSVSTLADSAASIASTTGSKRIHMWRQTVAESSAFGAPASAAMLGSVLALANRSAISEVPAVATPVWGLLADVMAKARSAITAEGNNAANLNPMIKSSMPIMRLRGMPVLKASLTAVTGVPQAVVAPVANAVPVTAVASVPDVRLNSSPGAGGISEYVALETTRSVLVQSATVPSAEPAQTLAPEPELFGQLSDASPVSEGDGRKGIPGSRSVRLDTLDPLGSESDWMGAFMQRRLPDLPDVMGLRLHDGAADQSQWVRQASALVEAMAQFNDTAATADGHSVPGSHVMLDKVTMPGLTV